MILLPSFLKNFIKNIFNFMARIVGKRGDRLTLYIADLPGEMLLKQMDSEREETFKNILAKNGLEGLEERHGR